jgi:hypothetical protein
MSDGSFQISELLSVAVSAFSFLRWLKVTDRRTSFLFLESFMSAGFDMLTN